jgi:septum formation protein
VSAVILASTSAARRSLLAAAGIHVRCLAPGVDEAAIKAALREEGADAQRVAITLAEAKAAGIAAAHPDALVIGADQMLDCDGAWFDKPADRQAARRQLVTLRGRTHGLVTAVAVAGDGHVLWRHADWARLAMRDFTDAFLDSYLEQAGDAALCSVGGYQLEGLGIQLFDDIRGDYFTILGLPMLPLLSFLRSRGMVSR